MIPHDPSEHVETMPGVGDLIGGRYRLESIIGHGALGTVMRAQHITMGREVAIKLLRPEFSNHPAIRRRLIQRVHQAQKLSHPNNCRLFDFGQSGGSLFLVMELLQGATLETIIARGAPYPVGWVLDIGMQILDGLGEAHDNNFIHRNLKPRNIFLLPRRRGGQQVKILDYGLASSLDSMPSSSSSPLSTQDRRDRRDKTGEEPGDDEIGEHEIGEHEQAREAEICGTAAYLAPETLVRQTSGKATDVYAVGLILIEMLTGRQVFSGDSLAQVLYRQIHTSVRLPPKLAWTSLGKVLMKSVSKHPGNRFRDADDFYEALEHASETTASYFRLDAADLEHEEQPLSAQMIANMLKKQRRRGGSDRDSSDDADDADDAEPEPRAPFAFGSGAAWLGRDVDDSALPPIPPPPPGPSMRAGGADNAGGRLRSSHPGGGARPTQSARAAHPLRALDETLGIDEVSFPRGNHTVDETGGGALDEASAGVDRGESSRPARLLDDVLALGDGGFASRAALILVALTLLMATVGVYLSMA